MKTITNELLKPVRFIANLVYAPIAVFMGKSDFGTVTYEDAEIEVY